MIIFNLTHLPLTGHRWEYKSKIYVKNIRKNSFRIRNQLKLGSGFGYEKNHSVSITLLNYYRTYLIVKELF